MQEMNINMAHAAQIVGSYLGNNSVSWNDIPKIINMVYGAIVAAEKPVAAVETSPQEPAVPIKKSITPGYIICLEDGKKLKMLKRYLRTAYDMTPDDYRAKWGLPADYPMVAPNYSRRRSEVAKQNGLGTVTHRDKHTRGKK